MFCCKCLAPLELENLMDKIRTIIEKEWAEVFKNRLVLFSVAFLPLILTALPLISLGTMQGLGGETADAPPDAFFGDLCVGLSEFDCTQVYMVNLFTLIFMILPVMIPVTIAAYSIVGEKTAHSLEPLLATPITTIELLIGKAAAAVIPAVVVTWIGFAIYAVGTRLLANEFVFSYLISPLWLIAIFVVSPLLALLSVNFAMMVSSRVTDPRSAEQLAGAVILPIILLIMGQSFGLILIDQQIILLLGLIVAVLDLIVIYLTVRTFERENILTRWK